MPPGKHQHTNNYLGRGRKMSSLRQGPVGGSDRTSDVSPFDGEVVGTEADRYDNLKDRFGRGIDVMPVTIWNLPMDRWQRDLRAFVGDEGQLRADSFMGGSFLPSENGGRANAASIFNPMLAAMLVQAYSQQGDLVIDPFAGGGTRAIISALMKRDYVGIDVRPDEVDRVNARIKELGFNTAVYCRDAARASWRPDGYDGAPPIIARKAEMLLTCPPYWNLEVYSEDPADLSTKQTYSDFLLGISEVIRRSKHGLKNGGVAVWVVGEFRHPETSELLDFPGDVARLHQEHGFWIYDRFVYSHANPQAFWRMGVFDKTRKLIRVHEHVIVAKWGGKTAARKGRRASGAEYLLADA